MSQKDKITQLNEKKRQLLSLMMQQKDLKLPYDIEPQDRDAAHFPLSHAQERLWTLQNLNPESSAYHELYLHHIAGPLDRNLLEESFYHLLVRHENLRTFYPFLGGGPRQVIGEPQRFNLPYIDLQEWPVDQQRDEAERQARNLANAPFDLENGPVWRVALFHLNAQEHLLFIAMHHIMTDGASNVILLEDLLEVYENLGYNPSLESIPSEIQFVDYAAWEREHLQGEELSEKISYWKQHLENVPSYLDMPTDYPHSDIPSDKGGLIKTSLTTDLSKSLHKLGKESEATLFMTLYAAYALLLARFSGQHDLVVGTVVESREQSELQRILGFFANTLPLRVQLPEEITFRELLYQVRLDVLDSLGHQGLPLDKILDELKVERSPHRSPLIQTLCVVQNHPSPIFRKAELILTPAALRTDTSKFELSLHVENTGDNLLLMFEYAKSLYSDDTVSNLVKQFEHLLKQIVAEPDSKVWEYRWLVESKQHEKNNTNVDEQVHLHHLFEQQVEKTPNAIALVYDEEELTYRELNDRANQMKDRLLLEGIKSGQLIGIYVPRSIHFVVASLAIFKVGCAYVPLDARFPISRIQTLIEESEMKLVLTIQEMLSSAAVLPVKTLLLDKTDENKTSEVLVAEGLVDSSRAYVLFTSGSTGTPKGVVVEHRNVISLFNALDEKIGCSPDDVFFAVAHFIFDASIPDLFWALTRGAKLIVLSESDLLGGPIFEKMARKYQPTFIECTPTVFSLILENETAAYSLTSLRKVLLGGEVLSNSLIKKIHHLIPGVTVYNGYGPTETTVYTAIHEASSGELSVPIGRALSQTHHYVLDVQGNPVPDGVTGELYIGGEGVTAGYLNQPVLTASVFTTDPFSVRKDRLMYRSGDLVRRNKDGILEYMGRIDQQIKIRGNRIELGEIEACLSGHPAIQQAICIVLKEAEDRKLAAYLVLNDPEEELYEQEILTYIKQKLPEYMVPSLWYLISELPITESGKVDRSQLLQTEVVSLAKLHRKSGLPRNETETQLLELWKEALQVKDLSIYDNFFDCGGQSILATRLIVKTREIFGIDLSVNLFYKVPTVAEFAEAIVNSQFQNVNNSDLTAVLKNLENMSPEEMMQYIESEFEV